MNPARPLFSLYGQSMLSVAYFDASTSQKERQFVTPSGCLAPAARWKTFESKWQKMLSKAGLLYFHMTDFEAYQGSAQPLFQKGGTRHHRKSKVFAWPGSRS